MAKNPILKKRKLPETAQPNYIKPKNCPNILIPSIKNCPNILIPSIKNCPNIL
jgi:hypothetical protein